MDIEKLIADLLVACAGNRNNIMGAAATALSTLQGENERMRAELDAAIKQLHGHCPACTHYTPNHNEGPCQTCKHEYYHLLNNESFDNWKWRGPRKED